MFALPYPPVAFAFQVHIAGDRSLHGGSFNEASGLDSETEIKTINEGGENRFSHRVPGRMKHQNLVLKRGIMLTKSPLMTWCIDCLEGNLSKRIETKDITVALLNEHRLPTLSWAMSGAYPVKWTVGKLAAQENAVALETVEFAYRRIKRDLSVAAAVSSVVT